MKYRDEANDMPANPNKGFGSTNLSRRRMHQYKASDVLWEIKERRTLTEKHFHMSDGTNIAISYEYPVHYKDEDGNLEDIDNRLVLCDEDGNIYDNTVEPSVNNDEKAYTDESSASMVSNDKREYRNLAGSVKMRFALTGAQERIARINCGEYEVSLSPIDNDGADIGIEQNLMVPKNRHRREKSVGRIVNNSKAFDDNSLESKILPKHLRSTVVYDKIFDNADLEYVACENALKENIRITETRDEYVYRFNLNTDGLTPVVENDGGISLKDRAGKTVFSIPAGYMFDAVGDWSNAVSYKMEQLTSHNYILTVVGDSEWINSANRVFPVTIDPPIYAHGDYNIETSTLDENSPDTAGGARQSEKLGYNKSTGKNYRMLVRVNSLPSLPDNSVVVNSKIMLANTTYTGDSMRIQAHALQSNSAVGETWCQHHTWNDCPAIGDAIDWTDTKEEAFIGWDVTRETIKWYENPALNYGICLKAANEGSMTNEKYGLAAFASGSASIEGNRPYFAVHYRNCAGLENYYTYQSHQIGRAGTGYIGDFSGQLVLVKGDISSASTINPVGLSHVYNSMYSNGEYSKYIHGAEGKYEDMKLGHGWMIDAQQIVEDADESYLLYADGDGTVHYFYYDEDENMYKDEDGMGLTIARSGSNFILKDKKDNISCFTNSLLNYHKDANGNKVSYIRNPKGQISTVIRQNSGSRIEKVATLNYNDDGYLINIVDEIGNTTNYEYDEFGRLISVVHPDGTSVSYAYNEDSKLICARDNESGYSMNYEYNPKNGKITRFYETVYNNEGQIQVYGAGVQADEIYTGTQTYRHCGPGRVLGDGDDILTHHILDYFGRTTSSYTTNADMSKIYGASCTKYSANAGTNATNNRVLVSSTSGSPSVNLLNDAGGEMQASLDSTSSPWTFTGGGTAALATDKKRTGLKSFKITREQADAESVFSQTLAALEANAWYVLSAYVNTAGVNDYGANGEVFIRGRGVATHKGVGVNWNSEGVGDDWERIYAVAQADANGVITLDAVASGLEGSVWFDDFQIENSIFDAVGGPGSASLIRDGNMSQQNVWTSEQSSNVSYESDAVFGDVIKLQGSAYESVDVYQDVQINLPGNKTYMLSGWAKAASVPLGDEEEGRKFDLCAEVYYEGETSGELHSESFNANNENWQYLCLPVVPKSPEKTVTKIRIILSFSNNPNTAEFTNVSFYRQDAQSYKYNEDGELISVTTSENEEQNFTYDGADLISQITMGNGTYEYEYDDRHNMIKASNDGVCMEACYNARGNTIGTTLSAEGTAEKISTSAIYSANGNLIYSQKDARGNVLRYSYDNPVNKQTAQPSSVTDAKGVVRKSEYDATNGRIVATGIDGLVSLEYAYSSGRLNAITRTAQTEDGEKSQTYTMDYDPFGNMTVVRVGNRVLATYSYGDRNGVLQRMTYGNGATVDYSYDALERRSSVCYNESDIPAATYAYSPDGSLGVVQDNLSNRKINYNYDALGRLLSVVEQSGDVGILRTHTGYDASNRVVSLDYALSPAFDGVYDESRSYTYTYNDADGSLASMSLPAGSSFVYSYDALKRLASRQLMHGEEEVINRSFAYLAGADENDTTLLVSSLVNSRGDEEYCRFVYGYDELGNIVSITDTRKRKEKSAGNAVISTVDTESTYVYDEQGQLIKEYCYSRNPANEDRDAYVLSYTYDANGNLLSWGDSDEPFVLSYEDENWHDLLTAFKGNPITYDEIGNPIRWYDGTDFTWVNGRRLASAVNTVTGLNVAYNYNVDGLRVSKTVNGVEHKYIWQGNKLISEHYAGKTLEFFYDESGKPCAMSYKESAAAEAVMYFYVTNLQGDILSVVDSDGFSVAEYYYNAWGLPMGSSGVMAEINPLRYRGYYYDTETGLYYVSSRYYDPEIGRFINADDIAYLGAGGLTSYNLFAYCGNNPVMGYDPYGTFDFLGFAKGVGRIVTGIAAVAAGVAVCVAGAPVAMIAVAAVTITAGVLTAVNGAADIQQSVTGNNFVRDTVFNGNQTAYDVYSGVTETVAAVGTAVCGNYLSTNCTMKGAVPGTEGKVTLEPGTTLDRYGSQYGRYLTDPGTPINQLALTPGNSCNLTTYVVNRPFTFRTGVVAPCAWGPGGGVQYFSWMSVQRLVQFGFLTPIG